MSKAGFVMKVVLCGDGAVGKTAIRQRYLGKGFQSTYLMTIGADFAVKEVHINYKETSYPIKFQIWDLAGQPRFEAVRGLYYAGCLGALMVFDVTRRDSFENLGAWLNEYFKHNGHGKQPLVVLGNKTDLREKFPNVVSSEEGHAFAEKLSQETIGAGFKVSYFDTSALTGLNISESFNNLGKTFLEYNERRKELNRANKSLSF
ncbi:MAG: Rab family GTPase [Promethearchaeota archaeon]